MARQKIQVLVVDDSPVDRELLIEIIQAEADFQVAGQAADAYEAREKIRTLSPDVVTLDVSMPGMDGIKFLRNLMRLRPTPVVMISVATGEGAQVTLEALEIGAVDFVTKPGASGRSFDEYRREVVSKVRMAAYARVTPYQRPETSGGGGTDAVTGTGRGAGDVADAPPERGPRRRPLAEVVPHPAMVAAASAAAAGATEPVADDTGRDADATAAASAAVTADSPATDAHRAERHRPLHRGRAARVDLIAIGASTGGVGAIERVLAALPIDGLPPVVITQHIPSGFSESFAQRLDGQLELKVQQAVDGMPVVAGHVYIAPGGHQFSIERIAEGYVCRVTREPRVNLHRPSVQVLFQSVARQAGARAIGVMLTGMGADGAQGLLEMRRAGAYNIVQDEQSSVVWGMPGAAAKMGAANEVLPLDEIPRAIAELIGAERGSLKRRLARRRSTRGHKPLE